jgi:uncharacterized protein YacL
MSNVSSAAIATQSTILKKENFLNKNQTFSKHSFEEILGRKLTWKERLIFWATKKIKKIKNHENSKKMDGVALLGFSLGIFGILLLSFMLGASSEISGITFLLTIISFILGIVFSAVGLHRINKNPETKSGKAFAVIGLILNIAAPLTFALLIAALLRSM